MQKQVNIKGALRRLHYGPGDHPSGSPQDVHAGEGGVATLEVGRILSIDDPDIAQKAIDFLVDKYGEASIMDFGDLWLGPDGRMAEVGWHAKAAVQFLEASNSELLSDYGGKETLRELEKGHATIGALDLTEDLIERGLIRVKIKPRHRSVTIQGAPPLTRRQARTIQDIIAMMPKERRELLGRTGFQWEFKKPEERIIFGRTSGFSVVDFYRAAGIVERHYGPGDHPSGSPQDVHGKGNGGVSGEKDFWLPIGFKTIEEYTAGKFGWIEDDKTYRIYHGTREKHVEGIRSSGLKAPEGTGVRWYMLTTDKDEAAVFAGSNGAVIEYRIPRNKVTEYLWPGALTSGHYMDREQVFHPIRKTLPSQFIYDVDILNNPEVERAFDKFMGLLEQLLK